MFITKPLYIVHKLEDGRLIERTYGRLYNEQLILVILMLIKILHVLKLTLK